MNLDTPIQYLTGVGPVFAKKLQKLGIRTIGDLLYYFPYRYEDFSNMTAINKIKVGQQNCISGQIKEIKNVRTWKRKMTITEALLEDKTAAIRAVWFNQPFLTKNLKEGDNVCLAGKVQIGKRDVFLSNPVYEKISSEKELTNLGRLVPVYTETTGLSSRWLRYIIKPLLEQSLNELAETLPSEILKENNFLPLSQALWQIHFPESLTLAEKAKSRFAFEELFLIELSVLQARIKVNQQRSSAIPMNVELMKKFTDSLSFCLTNAQRKCAWQILKDIERPCPMSRLLEGDVGSGKTVVAIMAALNTIKNGCPSSAKATAGWQVAFMAPTEILTKQHFYQAAKLLRPFKIKIALLTGKEDQIISQKLGYQTKDGFRPETIEISRNKILEKTKKGEIDLLIGTHTLIQDRVKFGKLGLVIIDEQHRFGVEQRARLVARPSSAITYGGSSPVNVIPHLLSMTATPIPRTLALTVYGDLDLSLIDEMPKGRKEIITKIIAPSEKQETYDFIRKEVKIGNRVFVICPRIEKSEKLAEPSPLPTSRGLGSAAGWSEAKAVKEEYEKLSKDVFPDLKVGMLHGKMKVKEKEKIMQNFRDGKIQILVSTSVVEVGVDIPKATIMLVEGAEHFGLAQLHQFRGRVGRADQQSYCFLFTESTSRTTRQRLEALTKAKNGFELAEKDLAIRGPGSLWGKKQWGLPDLAMANLTDLALVEKTREAAKKILIADPTLKRQPLLQNRVKTFEKQLHLE